MSRTRTVTATRTAKRKATTPASTASAPAAEVTAPDNTASLVETWYREHRRELPWRTKPTPYGVWVSEIMLQQTKVEAVRPYYARWMQEYPNVTALSRSSEDRVKELWSGLGYYRRAGYLLKGAQYVEKTHRGLIPTKSVKDLLKIPGIGDYTAGAIASIAGHQKAPSVDGNHIRVMSRYLALEGVQPTEASSMKRIRLICASVLENCSSPGDFNQGLMDIGATICTPMSPDCSKCPLSKGCTAKRWKASGEIEDIEGRFPLPKKKAGVREENWSVAVITDGDRVLMTRREGEGLLAGMYECPNVVSAVSEGVKKRKINDTSSLNTLLKTQFKWSKIDDPQHAGEVVHKFSHIHATMKVNVYTVTKTRLQALLANTKKGKDNVAASLFPLAPLLLKGKIKNADYNVSEQMRKVLRKAQEVMDDEDEEEESSESESESESESSG